MNRRTVFVIACLFLIVRLYFAWHRAFTPFELDYEEGNVLNAAVRILHSQTPYPPPGSFPYVFNPYGPIGYLISAAAVHIFGLALYGPRLLVLAAGAGIVLVITSLVGHTSRRADVGFLFGVLYLCSPLVWKWLPLLRVDFWVVLLSLIGIYFFIKSPRGYYPAAILFSLAILTKPTALAAPAACFVELAIEGRKKHLASFSVLIVGLIGGTLLALGPDFRFALFRTHPDPYDISRMLRFLWVAVQATVMPLAIILLALFSGRHYKANPRIFWLYGLTTSLTALTAGKLGSETNHFLEWSAAVCILAALSLGHLIEAKQIIAKPLCVGVLLLTGVFAVLPYRSVAMQSEQSQCAQAYDLVKSTPGNRILSEDVAALVLAGKPVIASNPFVVTQLWNRVKWSHGSLEKMVWRQEFDLILLGGLTQNFEPASGRWSPELIQNLQEKYKLDRTYACAPSLGAAYVPKK